jgi:hypothetical protein
MKLIYFVSITICAALSIGDVQSQQQQNFNVSLVAGDLERQLGLQARTHLGRFVDLSVSHFSNALHFTLPQKLPAPPFELSETKPLNPLPSLELALLTFAVATFVGVSFGHARSGVAQVRAAFATKRHTLCVIFALWCAYGHLQ